MPPIVREEENDVGQIGRQPNQTDHLANFCGFEAINVVDKNNHFGPGRCQNLLQVLAF